jgi:hypothetical protein
MPHLAAERVINLPKPGTREPTHVVFITPDATVGYRDARG